MDIMNIPQAQDKVLIFDFDVHACVPFETGCRFTSRALFAYMKPTHEMSEISTRHTAQSCHSWVNLSCHGSAWLIPTLSLLQVSIPVNMMQWRPMFGQCRAAVVDGGPALAQQLANSSSLLDMEQLLIQNKQKKERAVNLIRLIIILLRIEYKLSNYRNRVVQCYIGNSL